MLITSTWRISLGGIVLLDWGEYMANEPKLNRVGVVDAIQPLNSDFAEFIPRKNVSHVLAFSRVKICASDVEARNFLLAHTALLPKSAVYDCVIALDQVGTTLVMTGAVIEPGGYSAETESNRFIANYQLVGGELDADALVDAPEYYWSKITRLTGGVLATDLDAQPIADLPNRTKIEVITDAEGDTVWRKELWEGAPSPATDLAVGRIVTADFNNVTNNYVLMQKS